MAKIMVDELTRKVIEIVETTYLKSWKGDLVGLYFYNEDTEVLLEEPHYQLPYVLRFGNSFYRIYTCADKEIVDKVITVLQDIHAPVPDNVISVIVRGVWKDVMWWGNEPIGLEDMFIEENHITTMDFNNFHFWNNYEDCRR